MSNKQFEPNNFIVDKVHSYVLTYIICPKCGLRQEENELGFCPACGENLIIDKWSERINE